MSDPLEGLDKEKLEVFARVVNKLKNVIIQEYPKDDVSGAIISAALSRTFVDFLVLMGANNNLRGNTHGEQADAARKIMDGCFETMIKDFEEKFVP